MSLKEIPDYLVDYRKELIDLLHKSQDSFEKQLSYMSAGSLALSIGFIKDVVKEMAKADWKWLLGTGWILLTITLLINLLSHIRAASLHNDTIREINNGKYDQLQVMKRYKEINIVNWSSAATLLVGIVSIVIFVIKNIYHE